MDAPMTHICLLCKTRKPSFTLDAQISAPSVCEWEKITIEYESKNPNFECCEWKSRPSCVICTGCVFKVSVLSYSCARLICLHCRTPPVTTRPCAGLCTPKPGSCTPSWRRSRVLKRWVPHLHREYDHQWTQPVKLCLLLNHPQSGSGCLTAEYSIFNEVTLGPGCCPDCSDAPGWRAEADAAKSSDFQVLTADAHDTLRKPSGLSLMWGRSVFSTRLHTTKD